MKQDLLAKPIQQQKISQKQIQSLHLLMMNNEELSRFLQNEYLENPMLENSGQIPPCFPTRGAVKPSDKTASYSEAAAVDTDFLLHYFLEQLDPFAYTDIEWKIFKLLILMLDEQGFFPYSPEELCSSFHIPPAQTEKCLDILRSLEPRGIFQPDLKGYLLYQLPASGRDSARMQSLIQHHLEDIAAGRLRLIADSLQTDLAGVRQLIKQLRNLSPSPFSGMGPGSCDYITPDILAEYQNGTWDVTLNDNWIENYSLSDYYIQMMRQTADPELKIYFLEKYQRGRFILQKTLQRRSTILTICNAVISRQEAFFLGKDILVPMTLSDIAADVGLAISTVSRGIKNKYLQYPCGTVLLKSLFTSGIACSESEISSSNVISIITDIVRSENKKKPYSDSKLTELLNAKGIQISRRTVAKYRVLADIPSTCGRKE